jgi:hypothetical protein
MWCVLRMVWPPLAPRYFVLFTLAAIMVGGVVLRDFKGISWTTCGYFSGGVALCLIGVLLINTGEPEDPDVDGDDDGDDDNAMLGEKDSLLRSHRVGRSRRASRTSLFPPIQEGEGFGVVNGAPSRRDSEGNLVCYSPDGEGDDGEEATVGLTPARPIRRSQSDGSGSYGAGAPLVRRRPSRARLEMGPLSRRVSLASLSGVPLIVYTPNRPPNLRSASQPGLYSSPDSGALPAPLVG